MGFDEHEGGVRLTASLNGLRAQTLASGFHDDLSHLESWSEAEQQLGTCCSTRNLCQVVPRKRLFYKTISLTNSLSQLDQEQNTMKTTNKQVRNPFTFG